MRIMNRRELIAGALAASVLSFNLPAVSARQTGGVKIVERRDTLTAGIYRQRCYRATIHPEDGPVMVDGFALDLVGTAVLAPSVRVKDLVTQEKTWLTVSFDTDHRLCVEPFHAANKIRVDVYGMVLGVGQILARRDITPVSGVPVRWGQNDRGATVRGLTIPDPALGALSPLLPEFDGVNSFGQSNVQGGKGAVVELAWVKAVVAAGLIWQLQMDDNRELVPRKVTDAYGPLDFNNNPQDPHAYSVGHAVTFAAAYARDRLQEGRAVLILPIGQKGKGITDWAVGEPWMDRAERYMRYAMTLPGYRHVATVCQHGENDVRKIAEGDQTISTPDDYFSRLDDLIVRMKAIVGDHVFLYGPPAEGWTKFPAAKAEFETALGVWAAVRGVPVVDMTGLLTNQEAVHAGHVLPDGEEYDDTHLWADAQAGPTGLGFRHARNLLTVSG